MAYASISYRAYSFKPPEFTEADIKHIASIPFDEFREKLNCQIASERSQFQSEFPISRRVFTVSAALLVLAAIGMGISAYCIINNFSTGTIWNNLCFWTLLPGFLGFLFSLGYMYSLSSFTQYQKKKRKYLLKFKRKIDALSGVEGRSRA